MTEAGAHENATGFRWSEPKARAAVLLAADDLGEDEIAALVGVNPSTLWRWRQHPEFAAKVGDHVGRLQAAMLRYRIAKKRERLKALNDLHEKQLAVIEERAADMAGECPGGGTGLMVRQTKQLGGGKDATTVTEYVVDAGLIREIRATQEQAAKELGQWVEKTEVGGTVGVVRLVGVSPEDV